MKVLLVNGSPHKNGETYKALSLVEESLKENGIDTEWFWIGNKPVRGCIGCGGCSKKFRCVFKDDIANDLIEKTIEADGIIIGTPVYFSGPNGALTAVLDRVFYAGQVYGNLFVGKPASAIATMYRSGANHAVDRINKYFAYNSMPIVTGNYWGFKFGDDSFVPDDKKGRNTMHTIGKNMADLLHKLNNESQK